MTKEQLTVLRAELAVAYNLIAAAVFVAAAMILAALESPLRVAAVGASVFMIGLTVYSMVRTHRNTKAARAAEDT